MLSLKQINKSFGSKKVLDNISFDLNSGQITTFLGPNGAGKTTTIKIIAGLLSQNSGEIHIKNKSVTTEYIKEHLTYIPDVPFLYEYLTAREFLKTISVFFKITENNLNLRIDESLAYFNLDEIADDIISTYSHGLKQRLVFAMSRLKNSDILIIDEPMVGLDPKTAMIFKNYLHQEKKQGKIIMLSTHQLNVAAELSDNILIISRGKIMYNSMINSLNIKDKGTDFLEKYFLKHTE